jgi:hypothetical protein
MSHIPSSKMPHPHADGDTIDRDGPQDGGSQPAPEPTTALPPEQPAVAAPLQAGAPKPVEPQTEPDRSGLSAGTIAGIVVGATLAVGGLVAALLPLFRKDEKEPKAKKGKRKKN